MGNQNTKSQLDYAITIDGIWKVFGQRAQEALIDIKANGTSKAEVLDRIHQNLEI